MGGFISTPKPTPQQQTTTSRVTLTPPPEGSCPPPVTNNDYIIPPDNLENCIPIQAAIRYEMFQYISQKQGTLRSDFPQKIPFKYGKIDICPLYQSPSLTKLFPCNQRVLDYCKTNALPTYSTVNACIFDLNRKGGTVPNIVQFSLASATSTGRSLDTTVGTFGKSGVCSSISIAGSFLDNPLSCATTSISIRRGTTRTVSKTFVFSRTGTTNVSIPIGITVNANDILVFSIVITKAGCNLTATNVVFRCQF